MTAVASVAPSPRAAREATLAVLTEQQSARFGGGAARERQLERLQRGHGAVVTGQQLGLFGGPAYCVYKAATAVIEARRRDAVPVFWLQSEDHDLEEVRRATVLHPSGERVVVEVPGDADRISMAHRTLGAHVTAALQALGTALEAAPHRDACLELLTRTFQPGRAWGDAFGRLIAELFEELLVLDPRTPAMAAVAAPLHRWAIDEAEALDALLERRVAALGSAQVPLRKGCLLSFFHAGGPQSPRYRPVRDGEAYRVPGLDAPVTRQQLLEALEREPLSFSTSALLRPLFQDLALPTVAYVGGPSELHYLDQVKPLYAPLGITPPALVARARFVVTDTRLRRRLAALGVRAEDVEQPRATLVDHLDTAPGPDGEAVAATLTTALGAELERLRPELEAIDPSLGRALERTSQHLGRGVSRLARRVDEARRRRAGVSGERIAYVQARLYPGDEPQERVIGLPHLGAWHGPRAFVRSVLERVEDDRALKELPL